MVTKYFQSKYNEFHRGLWKETIRELGVGVYDIIIPCELAVVLGGYFENPRVFSGIDTIVFYRTDVEDDGSVSFRDLRETWELFETHKYIVWVKILKHYYDNMIDLTGLSPKESSERIKSVVETYQHRNKD